MHVISLKSVAYVTTFFLLAYVYVNTNSYK
jgi:hypothetical protein